MHFFFLTKETQFVATLAFCTFFVKQQQAQRRSVGVCQWTEGRLSSSLGISSCGDLFNKQTKTNKK